MENRFIYSITNDVNGRVFVGYAKDLGDAWKNHKKEVKNNNTKLGRAMGEIGVEHFHLSVLAEAYTEDEAKRLKDKYIAHYNAYEAGYNTLPGASYDRPSYARDSLKDMIQAGKRIDEIARELGISWDYIQRQAKKMGLKVAVPEFPSLQKGLVPIISMDSDYTNIQVWPCLSYFVDEVVPGTTKSRAYQAVKIACACWGMVYNKRVFYLDEVTANDGKVFRSPQDLERYQEGGDPSGLKKIRVSGKTVYFYSLTE